MPKKTTTEMKAHDETAALPTSQEVADTLCRAHNAAHDVISMLAENRVCRSGRSLEHIALAQITAAVRAPAYQFALALLRTLESLPEPTEARHYTEIQGELEDGWPF